MNDPKPCFFLLNPRLQCVRLNLLSLHSFHLIPLPLQWLSPIQLPHLKHEFLLCPHLHELPWQCILDRMMTVRMFNHLFQLLHMFLLESLYTLPGRVLIVGHVVVPCAGELHELPLLLVLYLLHLLPLRPLHVLLLPPQLLHPQTLNVHLGSWGLRILQSPLALTPILVQTSKEKKQREETYLMKSKTLKSGMKYTPLRGSMLPNSFFIMSMYFIACYPANEIFCDY